MRRGAGNRQQQQEKICCRKGREKETAAFGMYMRVERKNLQQTKSLHFTHAAEQKSKNSFTY